MAGKPPMGATLPPREFWFLRHGQTDWNRGNLAQGRTDVPLNAEGLAQAHAAAGLLAGRGIARIFASPLVRARVTAEIVGAALGLAVAYDPGLQEVAFGAREGQVMLAPWFADWVAGRATPEGAERFATMQARVVVAVGTALRAPGPVLIVAHGGMFRGLRAAMGLDPDQRVANGVPIHCRPGTPWDLVPAAVSG